MQRSRSDMLFHIPDVRWQTDKRTKIHSRRTTSSLQQLNNKSSHWQCVKSCLGSNIFWLMYYVELGFTVREVGREAYIAWGEAEHCIFLKNLLRVSPSCSSIIIFLDQFWWIPLAIPVCCEVPLDYIIYVAQVYLHHECNMWLQCRSNTKFNDSLHFAGINTPQCTASQTQAPVL